MNDSVAMYIDRNGLTTVVVTKPPKQRENIDKIIAFCQASGAVSSPIEGASEERYIIDFTKIPGLEYLGGFDEFTRDELYDLLEDLCDPDRPTPPDITDDELVGLFHQVEPNEESWID